MSGERLIVLCGSDLVGLLERRADGQLVFAYAPSFLASRAAFAISLSLPLQEAAFADERAGRFFANLLPEGRLRALVARRLGISADNDFALLAAVGGECAGGALRAAGERSIRGSASGRVQAALGRGAL
ncbi:MAG: HipA N-terminal domain-containing protein [Deltaproteobacteria bacterium]|nr:HipA N-terminal domain-containing protein [Deltaproteobacteria bacterium]